MGCIRNYLPVESGIRGLSIVDNIVVVTMMQSVFHPDLNEMVSSQQNVFFRNVSASNTNPRLVPIRHFLSWSMLSRRDYPLTRRLFYN